MLRVHLLVTFPGSNRRRELNRLKVPTTRLGEGNRKDRPIAVDNIRHEQQWDFMIGFFQIIGLQLNNFFAIGHVEDRTGVIYIIILMPAPIF